MTTERYQLQGGLPAAATSNDAARPATPSAA